MEKEFLVIINPNSGNGKGKEDWHIIKKLLNNHNISFSEIYTKTPNHAFNICIEKIKSGTRKFIVVGGDGTLNEVVNGIFSQKEIPSNEIILGNIPVGTANDWCRTYKIPNDLSAAVEIIAKGNIFHQDIGKATYMLNGESENRYFLNVAGGGFDAFVANSTNEKKKAGKTSPLIYLYTLLASLFNYKSTHVTMMIDNFEYSEIVFSFSLGICKYNGGGMMQLPNAIPNDGLFDITVIKKMSKLEIIKNIRRLYNGSIIQHPRVDTFVAGKVFIKSKPEIMLEVDGEMCGTTEFMFESINRALAVIVPDMINEK